MNPFDKLYPYQREAITTTLYNPRGIVCMPTGTGKTFCQAAIIANDIIMNPNQFRMYVINAPRILLTYQLLKEVYGFLIKSGIEARYMFVHSGGGTDETELETIRISAKAEGHNIPFSEIGASVSPNGVKDMMRKAKKQNLPLIMFSTYHSAEKIEEARKRFKQPISVILNDEAHYLVQEQFHDILRVLISSRCYFFTATTIQTPSDDGRGMNNVELYGEILYSMSPREAIEMGRMVRPRLHIVHTEGVNYTSDDYDKSLNLIIKDSFRQHQEVLSTQNPKLLISTKGTQDILDFINSIEYRQLRDDNVHIYAIASTTTIGNNINGERMGRQEFLRRLKADGENPELKLIVLHYDILAEGIDVSGFTGIMPMRTLKKSKFLQTYGRAGRMDAEDKIKLSTGEIKPHELNKMNKPFSYIIIPNIVHAMNEDDRANLTQIIYEMRNFDFDPFDNIIYSEGPPHGERKHKDTDTLIDPKKNPPSTGVLIQNLKAFIEAEKIASLTDLEKLKHQFPKE